MGDQLAKAAVMPHSLPQLVKRLLGAKTIRYIFDESDANSNSVFKDDVICALSFALKFPHPETAILAVRVAAAAAMPFDKALVRAIAKKKGYFPDSREIYVPPRSGWAERYPIELK